MPSSLTRLRPSPLLIRSLLAAAVLAVALLPGCKRPPAPLPGANAAPAAAVHQLAVYLRGNDLVGYAKAMVTPAQYRQLEAAWREGRSRWPLTELPLSDELPALLAALSRPDAEKTLQASFDAQIAGQAAGVRQAAQSLGLFGVQYLRNQGDYGPEQRAHYVQLVSVLSQWATTAPLTDRGRAQKAIAELVAAARRTGLGSEAALRDAGMEESLRRLGPFFATLKGVLAGYGLPLDGALDALRTGLVSELADQAQVRIQYPLATAEIDITASLIQCEGRWYLSQTQDEVARLLTAPVATPAPVTPDTAPTAGR
ncbi:MAG: hypothetical protein QM581_16135 [Pseudomonas sp.]